MFFLLGGPVKEPEGIKWHYNWNFMLSDNLMCTFPIGVYHNSCCWEAHYLVNFVVSADTALYCLSSVHPSGVTPSSGPFHPTNMDSWHATQPAYSTRVSRDVVGKLSWNVLFWQLSALISFHFLAVDQSCGGSFSSISPSVYWKGKLESCISTNVFFFFFFN